MKPSKKSVSLPKWGIGLAGACAVLLLVTVIVMERRNEAKPAPAAPPSRSATASTPAAPTMQTKEDARPMTDAQANGATPTAPVDPFKAFLEAANNRPPMPPPSPEVAAMSPQDRFKMAVDASKNSGASPAVPFVRQ